MVYTFARINAVVQMKVLDYLGQGRRGWVRLHEKGGKKHEVPCHHNLEQYLDEYIAASGIARDPDVPLFRASGRETGKRDPMRQQDAYRMIQRRRQGRRHQDPDRKLYLPCHGHHHVPEKQPHPGNGAAHSQPRVAQDHEAL